MAKNCISCPTKISMQFLAYAGTIILLFVNKKSSFRVVSS